MVFQDSWNITPKALIIFFRVSPLWYRVTPLSECSGNLSVLCTSWQYCERLHSASVNFFEDSVCLPISWWVIYKRICPHHAECSVVFNQKLHDPHAPSPLFTWSCPEKLFYVCFPGWKKSSKGNKHFADAEEVKQKMAKVLTGIQIVEFKNFWAVGKMSQ